MHQPLTPSTIALLTLPPLLWAGNAVVGWLVHEMVPPMALNFIRWMLASGGPGTNLTDFGEAEDANLATATVMVDIRRRFLRRRQAYFVWMLKELTLRAYERSRGIA